MAVQSAAPRAAVPARENKMTLASVTKGKIQAPYRLLISGVDGVGKTTFAANAPSPVFLGPESGTNHLDVGRFPVPETFTDMRDAIRTLTADRGEFQTLVIDSIDWVEPIVWAHVCASEPDKPESIEKVGGGYGKGYAAAVDQWRALLADLEQLQRKQGMHVILIAHAFVKAFRNPMGEDFDRYTTKLNDKAGALIREWCEGVYFAQFETFAVKEKSKRVKGVSSGARLLYTQRTAAYDAKDRYGVPDELPLDWEDFEAAVKAARPADPKMLDSEIRRKAGLLGGEDEKNILEWMSKHAGNASDLARLNSRVNAKLAEKAEREGA